MKHISESVAYKAASAQLNELTTAQAAAMADEAALMAQLLSVASHQPSALDRARAMLSGGEPTPRQDHDGLNSRLAACRETQALLADAVDEQKSLISGVVGAESVAVNLERRPAHLQAVEGVRSALAGLREALAAEQEIRTQVSAMGYAVTLESVARPEWNFADANSTISRFGREVDQHIALSRLSDLKMSNVRLLSSSSHGEPGDVLLLTGPAAAAMVRHGRAEVTDAKPGRAAQPRSMAY